MIAVMLCVVEDQRGGGDGCRMWKCVKSGWSEYWRLEVINECGQAESGQVTS